MRTSFLRQFLYGILLVGGLICLHIPFLQADPDYYLSFSRDANTDEGLYTEQVRNKINYDKFGLYESSAAIKTPGFSALMYLPLSIFGCQREVARLAILLISLLVLTSTALFYLRDMKLTLLLSILLYFSYYIFLYSHYSIGEMVAVSLIFWGISLYFRAKYLHEHSIKIAVLIALLLFAAFVVKFQFIYAIAIPIIGYVLLWIFDRNKSLSKAAITYLITISILLLGFYMLWYRRHLGFFQFVLGSETKGRFVGLQDMLPHIQNVLDLNFTSGAFLPFFIAFWICFAIGIYLFRGADSRYRMRFLFSISWVAVESHKLLMTYLPSRYLTSFYFSIILIICIVLMEMLSQGAILKKMALVLIALLFVKNTMDYVHVYKRRSFQIQKINHYLAANSFSKEHPVMGQWAASLCWNTRAYTLYLERNLFHDKDVFKTYHPQFIICEEDEKDIDSAFIKEGVHLDSLADSIRYFPVNKWKLKLVWIHLHNAE